jgi:hypothetical protein
MGLKGLLAALVLAAGAGPLTAQTPAERDWGAALREDATALHDDIAANHPGPVNPEDPGFAARNDAQLALALERARDARSYADYFFALREYVASFEDGHMGFGATGNTPNDFHWRGFVTHYDSRGEVRVRVAGAGAGVPVGAKLLGCDGMSAEAYAAATLGRMWGRWQLGSQRRTFGDMLFLSEESRYIPRAKSCTFEAEDETREVALAWRPIPVEEVSRHLAAMRAKVRHGFDARTLADGTRWYSIPSFNGDPQSEAGKALPPMIEAMRAARVALARAPRIVLDLRGNGGGSSDWSRQIADLLWGRAARDGLPKETLQVDWRASPANLASLEESYARRRAGISAEMAHWYETAIAGLRGAIARGERLWRHPPDGGKPAPAAAAAQEAPPAPLKGRVYLVTDWACSSACLDAVDLWRALGAIHVGQTTSADTLYMDIRQRRLPSGLTAVSMPMKVYRGRPRGSNEPVVPVHMFDGDIADTDALERWIASVDAAPDRF